MDPIEILKIIIKIALIVATLFHLFVSLIFLRQVRIMNRMVRTRPAGCIVGCNVGLSIFLFAVFLAVAFLL